MKRMLVAVAVLPALWASSAPASVIVSLDSVTPEGGGIYEWIYRAALEPDQTLRTGDFFTVYDVGSFLSANFGANDPSQQALFNVTQQPTGFDPPAGGPPESNLPNFTVHYTGMNIVPDPTTGEVTLGNLVIRSTVNQRTDSFFSAQSANSFNGAPISNGGALSVPVPEPSSIAMLVAGLAAVGGLAFRRKSFG